MAFVHGAGCLGWRGPHHAVLANVRSRRILARFDTRRDEAPPLPGRVALRRSDWRELCWAPAVLSAASRIALNRSGGHRATFSNLRRIRVLIEDYPIGSSLHRFTALSRSDCRRQRFI